MAQNSKIEWTDSTWNPVTGCTKISPGCTNCYAERMSKRLKLMGVVNYKNGFQLTLHPEMLNRPLEINKPQNIFVNSMSDLFHEKVPFDFIDKVFNIMRRANWHQFQILTKRSTRLVELSDRIDWPRNVWMGVSVENSDFTYRIKELISIKAAVKFLSLEPLLGPINHLDLKDIDWVIVGGESGPYARTIKEKWVIDIKNKCLDSNVPFFFKQWGGTNKKKNGRLLEGRTWEELPKICSRIYA